MEDLSTIDGCFGHDDLSMAASKASASQYCSDHCTSHVPATTTMEELPALDACLGDDDWSVAVSEASASQYSNPFQPRQDAIAIPTLCRRNATQGRTPDTAPQGESNSHVPTTPRQDTGSLPAHIEFQLPTGKTTDCSRKADDEQSVSTAPPPAANEQPAAPHASNEDTFGFPNDLGLDDLSLGDNGLAWDDTNWGNKDVFAAADSGGDSVPYNEFLAGHDHQRMMATSFPHVFMLGKSYNKPVGRLNHEEGMHLLNQFTLVPSRDRRLLGFLFDMMQRIKVMDGVKAHVNGSRKSLKTITDLLHSEDAQKGAPRSLCRASQAGIPKAL